MAIRFRRSMKIMPGVRLNVSKRGGSISVGPRGAKMTLGTSGVRATAGLPGSGLSVTKKLNKSTRQQTSTATPETLSVSVSVDENGNLLFLSDREPLSSRLRKLVIEQQNEEIQKLLQDHKDEINGGIERILNLHHETPFPDQPLDFQPISFDQERPSSPVLKQLGFFAKLFKSKVEAAKKENESRLKVHNRDVVQWEKSKQDHEKNELARAITFEKGLSSHGIMQEFLESVLSEIEFPRETFISFEINNDAVFVDIDLPEIEDLPDQQASIAKNGMKVNIKKRSDTQRRKDYMHHIHAIGFRVIGEIFRALPNIELVVCSGFSQRLDSSSGRIQDEYLFSVRVRKDDWSKINFSNLQMIDLPDCLASFDLERKMTKTGIFKAIEPFGTGQGKFSEQ